MTDNKTSTTGSSALTPSVLAFGASMLAVGLVLGYLLGTNQGDTSNDGTGNATDNATASAPAVVNKTDGNLRKLSPEEVQKLKQGKTPRDTSKKTKANPPIPKDSPFLTDAITGEFKDAIILSEYKRAVALFDRGNARGARPLLVELEGKSNGKPWREPVTAMLASSRAAVGEVSQARADIAAFKAEYPKSNHMATLVVAEGRAHMQEGKRIGKASGGKGGVSQDQEDAYGKAIASFDEAAKQWPSNPAVADGLFNKAAMLSELGKLEAALEAATVLGSQHSTYKNAARSLSNVGRAATTQGNNEIAEKAYQKVLDLFPRDRMAQAARTQLAALKLLGKESPELQISEWLGDDLGTMADLRGKPVMLVFWATWCPHCRREMPQLEETWQKFKDDGLVVIGVTRNSRGQTTEKVREYIGENGITVPIAVDPGGTSRAFNVSGIPAAAFVDKEGKVVFRNHPRQITDDMIRKYL
ncbi:MAG TPA: hypothetical protein DIU15_06135 [Deltaproteobacteria bacterium]|nr:hypothetical protein [Deltaproteobacteria bacterium]HCP45598.1 hypothetical protein [Deltaproteobacteria bacterium]